MEAGWNVDDAVEHVYKGDPIDKDAVLRNKPLRTGTAIAAVGVGIPFGLNMEGGTESYEFLLANGVYVPIAATAAVIGNTVVRRIVNRDSKKAQTAIREALNEPVDLIRTGRWNTKELVMRWYGLDDANATGNLVARSRQLLSFAKQHDIGGIIVNKAPFAADPAVEQLEEYAASTALSDKKNLEFAVLYDDETPAEKVVYASVEEFNDLVDAYETSQQKSVVEALVHELNDAQVAGMYTQFEGSTSPAVLQRLQSYLKQSIESAMGESHLTATKQPDGSRQVQKMHAINSIMKDARALNLQVGHDSFNGNQQLNFSGIDSLGKIVGLGSNEQLLQRVTEGDLHTLTKLQLQTALYVALLQTDRATTMHRGRQQEAPGNSEVTPFLVRVSVDDRYKASRSKRVARGAIKVSVFGAAFCSGGLLGAGAANMTDVAHEVDEAAFAAYATSLGLDASEERPDGDDIKNIVEGQLYEEYKQAVPSPHLKIARDFKEAMYELDDIDLAAQYAVAKVLLEDLNLSALSELFPDYEQSRTSRLAEKLAIETPPDVYTRSDNSLGIGDVSSGANEAVYTVESLTGASTAGYWYEQSYAHLQLIDDAEPQRSTVEMLASHGGLQEAELPKNLDQIMAANPDYKVETPYIGIAANRYIRGGGGSIALPVKYGGAVTGVRVVDKLDASKIYYPNVLTNGRGRYEVSSDELNFGESQYEPRASSDSPILARDMQQPVLQYWVKNDQSKHFAVPFEYLGTGVTFYDKRQQFIPNNEKLRSVLPESTAIAQSVRQGLGLPKDASAGAVLQAISEGKQYAYEPLEYDDTDLSVPEQTARQTAIELGNILTDLRTANCNLAAVTMLLATIDRNQLQTASGFRNDGDGLLTQQEAHAWNVDAQGEILDATPTVLAPGVTRRTAIDETDASAKAIINQATLEKGALTLVGAACAVLAYRRRVQIAVVSDRLRTRAVFAHPAMAATVDKLSHDLYARPHATYVVPSTQRINKDAAEAYVKRVPMSAKIKGNNLEPSERLRRTILRLNQAAIRRHVATKIDQPSKLH